MAKGPVIRPSKRQPQNSRYVLCEDPRREHSKQAGDPWRIQRGTLELLCIPLHTGGSTMVHQRLVLDDRHRVSCLLADVGLIVSLPDL